MVAVAFVVAAQDAPFLLAVSRAHTRVNVDDNAMLRATVMNAIDPSAGKLDKNRRIVKRAAPPTIQHAAGLHIPELWITA